MNENEIQRQIKQWLETAIEEFNEKERFLIENDLSERCICSRFCLYLEKCKPEIFEEYCVDVEYNRGMHRKCEMGKSLRGKKVVLDLIVHKRELDESGYFDNLFCIEMKKTGCDKEKLDSDLKRLKKLVDPVEGFCYKAGFMIMIGTQLKPELSIYDHYEQDFL